AALRRAVFAVNADERREIQHVSLESRGLSAEGGRGRCRNRRSGRQPQRSGEKQRRSHEHSGSAPARALGVHFSCLLDSRGPGTFFPPPLSATDAQMTNGDPEPGGVPAVAFAGGAQQRSMRQMLSDREIEVLLHVARGETSKEIAASLGIGE